MWKATVCLRRNVLCRKEDCRREGQRTQHEESLGIVRTCFFFCESARKLSSLHLPCRRTGGVVWSGGCLLACSSGHCHCAASGSDRQSCLLTSARPLPLKYTSSKVAMAANVHERSAESPTPIAWTTFSTISNNDWLLQSASQRN
jgi:hypothetical protein